MQIGALNWADMAAAAWRAFLYAVPFRLVSWVWAEGR